jgi:hypothetical protein
MAFDPVTKLNKLLQNKLDNFEVLSECQKLNINIVEYMDFSCQKYLLQKSLLLEILKIKDLEDKNYYEKLLESTIKFLRWKAEKVQGYPCRFVGCLFKGKGHRKYLKHLKNIHPSQTTFCCMFKLVCKRNFLSIEDLENHVKSDHSDKDKVELSSVAAQCSSNSEFCKCCMISCGQKHFNSIKELTSHINTTHAQEPRFCVFRECNQLFRPGQESRWHFRVKHFQAKLLSLKDENKVPNVTSIAETEMNSEVREEIHQPDLIVDQSYEETHEDIEEHSDGEDAAENDEEMFFMMAYCDFLNRLTSFKFIPLSSVKSIAEEYIAIAKKSALQKEKVLHAALMKCPNLSMEDVEEVVREVSENDLFLKAQQYLLSEHKRSKFISEHFNLVKPVEVILNPEEVKMGCVKECYHYIPIRESLKVLLEDKTFNDAFEAFRNENVEKKAGLEDIKDGLGFQNNQFFHENPDALTLQLYSDALEVTNPLGSGRLKHKIVQVFWSICDIHRRHRSKIDKLQVGLVFREKLLKKYTFGQIFKHLVDDLKVLEDSGIDLEKPVERTVKAGLIAYVADNLEVSVLTFPTKYLQFYFLSLTV